MRPLLNNSHSLELQEQFLKKKLEDVLASNTRVSSSLSMFLALLYLMILNNYSVLNQWQWFFGFALISGLSLRLWWGFQSSKAWLTVFTIFNTLVSVGWAGILTSSLLSSQISHAIESLTYVLIAGLIGATPHSMALSKKNFYVFLFCIFSPLILRFALSDEGSHFSAFGIFFTALFAVFLVKQRSQQQSSWRNLQLFNFELQTLIDSLPVGVAVLQKGILTNSNNFFNSLLLKGESDESKKSVLNRLMNFSQNSTEMRTQWEVDLQSSNGKAEAYLIIALRTEGPNGQETIVSVINVHDLRSLEKENEKQRIQMENNSKMAALGVMSSGLAHEINNPLATISGRVQLIHMVLRQISDVIPSEQNEKINKSVEVIQKTIQRISKIIRGLRSFSRETEGGPFERVQLKEVIETTMSFCETRFLSQGVDLQWTVEPDLEFRGRPTELSQVILNALNNSYDAVEKEEKKWIRLIANQQGKKLIIRVQDSGTGIPPEHREKIMLPFFTTKEVGKGTGLGLSLSRGIVESHGGQIYFNYQSPFTELVIELPLFALEQPKAS